MNVSLNPCHKKLLSMSQIAYPIKQSRPVQYGEPSMNHNNNNDNIILTVILSGHYFHLHELC